MASNTAVLAASSLPLTVGGTSTPSAASYTGSFVFEQFANFPKLVRVTYNGTTSVTLGTAGSLILTLTALNSNLPSWAIPATMGSAPSATNLSTTPCGTGSCGLGITDGQVSVQRIYNAGNPASVFICTFVLESAGTVSASPSGFSLTYIAQ